MNDDDRYDDEFDWGEAAPSMLKAVLWVLVAMVIAIGGALIFGVVTARAHDAPTGWAYPISCCSGIDCREVADKAISEPSQDHPAYIVKATGEQLAQNDTRIRPSPDGRFHWCSVRGADDSRTICLFVPPRGF